jgi:hypothetical protein
MAVYRCAHGSSRAVVACGGWRAALEFAAAMISPAEEALRSYYER